MIFIDANMYLEFYGSGSPSMKKLLPALEALAEEIFVTEQVANEVLRNRVQVAARALRVQIEVPAIAWPPLPVHLDESAEEKVAQWNKVSAELKAKASDTKRALGELADALLRNVVRGVDPTSNVLRKVFERRLAPVETELERARWRREFGNPPGKRSDPLGDQVSWEQLLSRYDGSEPLWLITNDSDYHLKVGNARYLDAFLFEELRAKALRDPEVFCFDSLAAGIKHISEHRAKPVEGIPSGVELDEIAAEEVLGTKHWGPIAGFPPPIGCVICGSTQGFVGPVARPSQYGGWTMQWQCKACRKFNDFGEPYDE